MTVELYKEYCKERVDREVIVHYDEHGVATAFVSYKMIDEQGELGVYLVDMFISKSERTYDLAKELTNKVADVAVKNDIKKLYTSVDVKTNGADRSMKVILHYGFVPYSTNGNMVYFVKDMELSDG